MCIYLVAGFFFLGGGSQKRREGCDWQLLDQASVGRLMCLPHVDFIKTRVFSYMNTPHTSLAYA